jgi:hypothetical protein
MTGKGRLNPCIYGPAGQVSEISGKTNRVRPPSYDDDMNVRVAHTGIVVPFEAFALEV